MQASKFKALRWTKPFWCYYNITVAKNGHVSLKAVAEAAGVSAMTVSRVFRHSPKVSTATRDRVLEAAAQLGYRPDPLVAQLMERIRMHRQHGERATLALLYEHVSEPIGIHHYVTLESVRARAEPHGYRVDAIRVGKGGLSPKRVQQVLEAGEEACGFDYCRVGTAVGIFTLLFPRRTHFFRSSTRVPRYYISWAKRIYIRKFGGDWSAAHD